ncbi:MAG: hypothetical protein WBC91_26155 [Phototrophicaceae bacterium]
MNIILSVLPMLGVVLIFAAAAWAGPKVIRAIYPEEKHATMLSLHRKTVIAAIIFAIVGGIASSLTLLLQSS